MSFTSHDPDFSDQSLVLFPGSTPALTPPLQHLSQESLEDETPVPWRLLLFREWLRRTTFSALERQTSKLLIQPEQWRTQSAQRSQSTEGFARSETWRREVRKIFERLWISLMNDSSFRESCESKSETCISSICQWADELRNAGLGPARLSPQGSVLVATMSDGLALLHKAWLNHAKSGSKDVEFNINFSSRVLTVSCTGGPKELAGQVSVAHWPEGFPLLTGPSSRNLTAFLRFKGVNISEEAKELAEMGSKPMPDDMKDVMLQFAVIAVRYDALIPQGQQWAVPLCVRDAMRTQFGVNHEGFASPFNFDWKNKAYGSLFVDSDPRSIGPFVDGLAQREAPIGSWLVNPPFVETILEDAVQACLKAIERDSEATFLILLPEWRDSKAHLLASKASQFRFAVELEPGSFFFEGPGLEFVRGSFPCTLFCLRGESFSFGREEMDCRVHAVLDAWSSRCREMK